MGDPDVAAAPTPRYMASMNVTLPIPDDLAIRLGDPGDLARRALEAFASDEFRAGRLTHPELRLLLGLGTHAELDGFLKQRGLFAEYSVADLDQEREDLRRLGL
jgi:hypothetical protein